MADPKPSMLPDMERIGNPEKIFEAVAKILQIVEKIKQPRRKIQPVTVESIAAQQGTSGVTPVASP